MLVITSINRWLSVGWVVDRMPVLSAMYVSIGQLVEDSADMLVWSRVLATCLQGSILARSWGCDQVCGHLLGGCDTSLS